MKKSHYSTTHLSHSTHVSPTNTHHIHPNNSSTPFVLCLNDHDLKLDSDTLPQYRHSLNARGSNEDLYAFLSGDLCNSNTTFGHSSKYKHERRKSLLTSFEDAQTINALNPLQKQMNQLLNVSELAHNGWKPPNYDISSDNGHSFLSPKLFHSKKLLDSNIHKTKHKKKLKNREAKKYTNHTKRKHSKKIKKARNKRHKSTHITGLNRKISINSLRSTYSENNIADYSRNIWKTCDFLEEKSSEIYNHSKRRSLCTKSLRYNGKKLNRQRSKTLDINTEKTQKKIEKLKLKLDTRSEHTHLKRQKSKKHKKRSKSIKEHRPVSLSDISKNMYKIGKLSEDETIRAIMEDCSIEYYPPQRQRHKKHRKSKIKKQFKKRVRHNKTVSNTKQTTKCIQKPRRKKAKSITLTRKARKRHKYTNLYISPLLNGNNTVLLSPPTSPMGIIRKGYDPFNDNILFTKGKKSNKYSKHKSKECLNHLYESDMSDIHIKFAKRNHTKTHSNHRNKVNINC